MNKNMLCTAFEKQRETFKLCLLCAAKVTFFFTSWLPGAVCSFTLSWITPSPLNPPLLTWQTRPESNPRAELQGEWGSAVGQGATRERNVRLVLYRKRRCTAKGHQGQRSHTRPGEDVNGGSAPAQGQSSVGYDLWGHHWGSQVQGQINMGWKPVFSMFHFYLFWFLWFSSLVQRLSRVLPQLTTVIQTCWTSQLILNVWPSLFYYPL